MDWLTNVSPVWREYFLGAAGDATGGLVAQFVIGLLHTARRQVRERFHLPEQMHALQNAIAGAFDTALGAWTINDDASTHDHDLFRDWLLNPAVLNEFCTLLAPDDKSALNLDLLREKFEDTGLSADHLGTVSFDVLVQDMVGAFYFAAAKEPALQASLQISLLRQMAERMGALERLEQVAQRQVVAGAQPVDLLIQIRQLTQQAAVGQGNTNELLQTISELLMTTAQHGSSEELRTAYQQSELVLTTVGLPTSAESRELRVRLREILSNYFNESELQTFCFDLGISYENLPGSSKADRARELVVYCERHERTHDLIQTGAHNRPDIDWPGLHGGIREQSHGILVQELPALARVLITLDDIHARLTTGVDGPSPEKRAAIEAHYRQTIIDQFEKLTFKGLSPSGTPIVLPLEQVYVELKAVADVPEAADTYSAEERRLLLEAEGRGERVREELAVHLDVLRAERWNLQARQDMARLQRRSIQEILDNPAHRGVVILGEPGSGKTTLLHYQALRTARASGDGSAARAPLPIFVPLAAYDDFLRRTQKDRSLGDFLAVYYDQWHSLPGLAPLFQHALAEGRAMVLLDGLDEVLDTTTRQFVAEQAGAFIRHWAPRGNRFAVTSRIVGYREARLPGDMTHLTVLDFGRTEIELFAHQWCRSYEAWVAGAETPTSRQQAVAEERAFLEDVRSNPSVEQLAAGPLLLTMLALLRRYVGKLPDRRIELYERYIRTLIDNWHTVRSPGARQQAPERFDPHTAIAYLIELAFWLQQHKPSGIARRQELEQVLETICLRFEGHDPATASPKTRVQAQQTAVRFLQEMRYFAGLLAECGHDFFGFLHRAFEEYFFARALARMEPDERWAAIQPHLHRPRWLEPILLCAGQLGIVEQRRDRVSDLALRILNAGSLHESILHRDLFLAAALAAADVGLFPTPLNTIATRLASLQASPILIVRNTALAGLAQLARLGHALALASLEESLRDPALQQHSMRAVKAVIGADACTPLRQLLMAKLDDPDGSVRQAVVEALAGLVASDAGVRQALMAKLDDPDGSVLRVAVEALAGLVASDAGVRQALMAKLDDPDGSVRQAVVEALAGLVASDAGVRQALMAKLDDPDGSVLRVAVEALAGLVASDAGVRQALMAKLDDPDGSVRQAVVEALAGLVASDAGVRQALMAKLDDPAWNVRQAVVEALAGLVASDAGVRQALMAKLDDPDGSVRQAVVEALAWLVASDATVWQALMAKLDDISWNVRVTAVGALASLVRHDVALQQALERKLKDASWNVRVAAVGALADLVKSDDLVMQHALKRQPNDEDNDKWRVVTETLVELVKNDATVWRALDHKPEDEDNSPQQEVIKALVELVKSDPVAMEELEPLIGNDDTLWRTLGQRLYDNLVTAKFSWRDLRKRILSHADLTSISPFVITGPAPDDMFFGRDDELREITENIIGTSYILIGGRRIGKTSILKRLERIRLPSHGFKVYFHDCSPTPTQADMLHAIANDEKWFHEPPNPIPSSFAALIRELPSDKHLVVLLDEADKLIPSDRTAGYPLFNSFRALANHGRCRFVLSGEYALRTEMRNPTSPLYNFANQIVVGCLGRRDVGELVNRAMGYMEIELIDETAIIYQIYRFTSGHPNVVQRLCSRLIEHLSAENIRRITPADIDEVIKNPKFQEEDFLDTYWERATPLEKIISLLMGQKSTPYRLQGILELLAVQHLNPKPEVVKAALDRLVDLRSILKRTQAGYEFAAEAFPLVLASTTTFEDLLIVLKSQYHGSPEEFIE